MYKVGERERRNYYSANIDLNLIATPQPQEVSGANVEPSQNQDESVSVPNELAAHLDSQGRAAHRRLQKRLYMRRKRAEQTGREITMEAVKLRPGRASNGCRQATKRNNKKSETPEPPTPAASAPEHESESDAPAQNVEPEANVDGEGVAGEEEKRKGGLNKAYRVKQILLENGIDADVLSKMNLDLFHLTTLSRVLKWVPLKPTNTVFFVSHTLSRLFKSFDGPTEPAGTSSISTDTLHLLSTILVEFVSELIRRAIVSKEQEIRLKQSLPIWKYDKYEVRIVKP
jgi:hypothetical protein